MNEIKQTQAAGLTSGLREKFLDLACQLSPENRTCDGECPMHVVRRRRKTLLQEWRALERQAGRRVTESEVWGV